MKRQVIVLIGMPGVGKTTLGKELSQRLQGSFIDTDDLIEEKDGREIPMIFKESGERYFRDLETGILKKIFEEESDIFIGEQPCIIALGGGTIQRNENFEIVKNGKQSLNHDALYDKKTITVIFLERSLEKIKEVSVANRPVSQTSSLEELYEKRLPMYRRWADFSISMDDMTPSESASCILEKMMLS